MVCENIIGTNPKSYVEKVKKRGGKEKKEEKEEDEYFVSFLLFILLNFIEILYK